MRLRREHVNPTDQVERRLGDASGPDQRQRQAAKCTPGIDDEVGSHLDQNIDVAATVVCSGDRAEFPVPNAFDNVNCTALAGAVSAARAAAANKVFLMGSVFPLAICREVAVTE